jgi:8-oxo-dGTP pyrophosphatase MutT (NUDIX family)
MKETEKTGVGAIFLCSKTSRVMLNLRAPYKTHSLCWSLWGGMMESGETPKETLLRELDEEIGFVPDIEKFYPFDIYESKDGHFRYYTFVCVVDSEFTPDINQEAVGYAWTKLGVWPKPMHSGAKQSLCKKKSVEKLHMILEQHK